VKLIVQQIRHSDRYEYIQNIPDWCRHLYNSCGTSNHR
jgi:hypothetical protein